MAKYEGYMFAFMNITKALADENRVRILMALHGRDALCVCQLIDMLQLAPSTVSKHLSVLKNARLVDNRKIGRWIYYRLVGEGGLQEAQAALSWTLQSVQHESRIKADALRLEEILQIDPEVLCSRQAKSGECRDNE